MLIGATKEREAAGRRVEGSKLHEELFEFQVGIAGIANSTVDWQPADVVFPAPMIPAPMQRDSDLEVPQFFYGAHLYVSSAPVVVTAHVSEWTQDDADYTTGAKLQVGAWTPGLDEEVEFSGYVHLTFQGYSGPAIEDDDEGVQ